MVEKKKGPMTRLIHASDLLFVSDDNEDDSPADSFVIFPKGVMRTSKGNFMFDDVSAALVMQAYGDHGMAQLPIDYDHGMLSGKPSAESSSAAGWFTPSIVDGSLVAANVEWTPRAVSMLKHREFRHYSPAFDVDMANPINIGDNEDDKAYRITRLVNVALTNLPATKDQIPLVASENAGDSIEQTPPLANKETESMHLLKLFGLESEAEVAQQATRLLSAVPGAKTLADVLANINELKDSSAKSIELAQRVAELEAEKVTSQRDALIAKLSKEGKAPPSIHAFLRTLSFDQVKSFGDCAPTATSENKTVDDTKEASIMLSDEDEHVLSLMPNVSREAFIAERKREQINTKTKKAG